MASLCIVIDVARKWKLMIIAKHAMTNCQQFIRKKTIKRYESKTVSEWIDATKDSINSMTSKKMVVDDSSIDNQDGIVVKAVADMEDLEIVTDKEVEYLNVEIK